MIFTSLIAAVASVLASPGDRGSWDRAEEPAVSGPTTAVWPLQDYDDDDLDRGGMYLQFSGGLTTTTDSDGPSEDVEFDEGWAAAGVIGSRFGTNDGNAVSFDLELEILWSDQDADDEGTLQAVTDVTVLAGLINGLIDIELGRSFSIYAGAGIGAAGLDVGTTSDAVNDFEEDDGPFLAWQAKAGLRLWAMRTASFFIGYRFLNIDDAEIDDDLGGASFDLETSQHVAEVGVRFQL